MMSARSEAISILGTNNFAMVIYSWGMYS